MITSKNKDPRSVLNSLHFGLWNLDISNNNSYRRSNSIEREEDFSLSEFKKRAKILSNLDAAFGPGEKNISILTKCSINLDFNNENDSLNNFYSQIEIKNEMRLQLFESVDMNQRFLNFLYLLLS